MNEELIKNILTGHNFIPDYYVQEYTKDIIHAVESHFEDKWVRYSTELFSDEPSIASWWFLWDKVNGLHKLPAMYTRFGQFIYSDRTKCGTSPEMICIMKIPAPPKQ